VCGPTDRLLCELQQAAGRLDSALASITGRLPEETQQELEGMRGLLQRARFELSPQHAAIMAMFREGGWILLCVLHEVYQSL
jgi:hypothetical protein